MRPRELIRTVAHPPVAVRELKEAGRAGKREKREKERRNSGIVSVKKERRERNVSVIGYYKKVIMIIYIASNYCIYTISYLFTVPGCV